MKFVEHVETMRWYRNLSGRTERTLEKCNREQKGNVREMGSRIVDKVFLVQNGEQCKTSVNAAMNYLVQLK